MTERRIIVFIDAQNMYKGARDAFFTKGDPATCGQFHPVKLAHWIGQDVPRGDDPSEVRKIIGVRTYQGAPSPKYDAKGYSADRRHRAAWTAKGVDVTTRPMRYVHGQDPHEKGIDVALAVDFVAMGIDREYDIGVLASADTDLVPALEYLLRRGVRVETAVWLSTVDYSLKVPGYNVWCHQLRRSDYERVEDMTDYNRFAPRG